MDLKEINNYGQEMLECLKLKTSPVAVKLIPKGEKVPEGIEKVDEAMRHCQLVDRVRRTGEEFYTLGEDQMCKGGAGAMGLGALPPKVASGEFYYKGLKQFSTQGAARRTIEMVPTLTPNSTEAVLYAPLEKTTFMPDVVVVICNPKQIMLLTQAYMYKTGGRLEASFAGKQSLCSDGVVQAYKEGKIGVTVGCSGSRAYTEIADEEMIMGIPVELLPDVIAGLRIICPK
ncbi:hypothetical protein EO95_18185 [Methanosarcina sp. 1.H.T.1A.1]|uniref:DUF169 domain-containing protein n=1 Tax=unclassified Methanosarcina TaxID=2644672 RepID=UPI000622B19A|nr:MULTISPECIES: DUF169 domain-containing protein [unclassified Methanosarcina]KKH49530.1 hypothetical protein EO93_15520 [Methanosarcina sp. 1.H.A.2.2]KKH98301.1 hypothetical protein EO95_18185 [Methanosarcina sp. 1.H.T.1A.1]